MSQGRYWCFTINNPDASHLEFLRDIQAVDFFQYVIFQLEAGQNETPHYQGYVEYSKNKRFKRVKHDLGERAHVEKRKGNKAQAIAYCTKEDSRLDGPWTAGETPENHQGERTDIEYGAALVKEEGLQALVQERPELYVRHSKGFELLSHKIYKPEIREDLEITLLIGNPGAGKTTYVYDKHGLENVYTHEPGQPWFDGYERQPVLLLDD